jgi:phenylalanyl-tRNA synthetase beta chain
LNFPIFVPRKHISNIMRISYNWLKQYINTDIEPIELAKILTDTGLEVEGMEIFESVKGGFEGIVIGKVLTCDKHPNADKLSVTTVDIGTEEPVQIVCGAPNIAAGQTVPVATVGATLYPAGSDEGFTIKKAKIRGEASFGMICAEDELGLGTAHDGIMVLEDKVNIGSKASDYFDVEKDTVFEIGLTPNRIDGASHIGVARDLSAYLQHNGTREKLQWPSIKDFKADNHDLLIELEVKNNEACKRYSAITLSELKVKESPAWLQNRLRAIGQTPINNVVDITNYVLHEVGQPLHAFDTAKITGNKVIVQTLPEGSKFVTLDEKERELTARDLMICNTEGGMCIAGVFGGIEAGVTEETTSIFLESACFDPVYIRKTARHHVLNTDASFRFERGTDPNITVWAMQRAALLMKEIAGAKISSEVIDIYPDPVENQKIEVSFASITRLIGKRIDADVIQGILESLDIVVEKRGDEGMLLSVPPYRVDVLREADIVEEILRIYGYNNVEFGQHVNSTLTYTDKPDKEKVVNTISDMLSGIGFLEIKSNSLTSEGYFDEEDSSVVKIFNPLSKDLSRMRQDLLKGGLEAILYNVNRKKSDLKLYEFGNCYFHHPEKETDHPQKNYGEESHLGIFITGDFVKDNWTSSSDSSSFYHIKSLLDLVLGKLGIANSKLEIKESTDSSYSDALDCFTGKGKVLTYGKVSDKLLKVFDIDQEVYSVEFNWDLVMRLARKSKIAFKPLPKFPEVKRDLSLMLNKDVKFEQLTELAYKSEKRLLKNIELFDIYEGDKIEAGKKSYAISFILMDEEKTLTDKQIEKVMMNISRTFERELNAVVRGA